MDALDIWLRYWWVRFRHNPVKSAPWSIILTVAAMWALHHFWHWLFDMQGTTLLKVVGYGAIPTFLALAGNHLATKAIRDARQRRMWRIFFMTLGFGGVLLIAIVEKQAADSHDHEVHDYNQKLEELHLDFKSVLLQMGNIGENFTTFQKDISPIMAGKIASAPPTLTEEARMRKMSNSEFRPYAIDWAKKLRDFETKYDVEDEARFLGMPNFGSDQAARNAYMASWSQETVRRDTEHLNEYKNDFWSETVAIYNDLERRYKARGKALPQPWQLIPFDTPTPAVLIQNTLNGELTGPHPIGELADYIEMLARKLPN